MKLKIAQISDIENILKLHYKYQVDSIKEEDKKDGFVTTAFTADELENIIRDEKGIFIAIQDDEVVAYVMSASWKYWSKWKMFEFMVKNLPSLEFNGQEITKENSYQYGPVCIDKSVRGSGILEELFDFSLESMSKRFSILVTFVNKINPRSYAAHKRKLGLEEIAQFEFNNNFYHEFAFDTSKRVLS